MKKITFFLSILFIFLTVSCKKEVQIESTYDFEQIKSRDTLRIGTMYGSSTYFLLKGEKLGFDYELCEKFAQHHNLEIDIKIATSTAELEELLQNKEVDLVAYRMTITNSNKKKFLFTENKYENKQVIVQRAGRKELNNVVDLIGKEIYVIENSKYEARLQNLNDEIGGGINIHPVADTTTVEQLIEWVSNGTIDFTIAEYDIALLNRTYFRNIDCKLSVSFPQRAAWAVNPSTPILLDSLNSWLTAQKEEDSYNNLYRKYFRQAKYFDSREIKVPRGHISPYDEYFKENAKKLNWDWRLLAAVAYQESKFDTSAISWVGARGVMQLMPSTAKMFDIEESEMSNPATNIKVAADYLKKLNHMFWYIEKEERIKFILASYNAGPAHVLDAMALAEKYGSNSHIWYGCVEKYLKLKSQKEFYTDSVVKSGYFSAVQTISYVYNVLQKYDSYCNRK